MRVRVYRPAKSAAQSGRGKTHQWVIEPELLTPRAPDPIMGWASAADTLSELVGRLLFPSLDDALAFVRQKGWEAVIEPPVERLKFFPLNIGFKPVAAGFGIEQVKCVNL
jgi:hypothetical protein